MPRAPTYQPGQVASARGHGQELRPVDDGGGMAGALGRGLQQTGEVLARQAELDNAIQDHFDETTARKAALEYQRRAETITSEFAQLEGENAMQAAGATAKRLEELREEFLGAATNPRQKSYLEQRISPLELSAQDGVRDHTLTEQKKNHRTVVKGEMGVLAEQAATQWGNPAAMARSMSALDDLILEEARIDGVAGDSAEVALRKFNARSALHRMALSDILNNPFGDVDMAEAYYAAHEGDMNAKDRDAVQQALKGPREQREVVAGFNEIVSGFTPEQGEADAEAPQSQARQTPVSGATKTDDFKAHTRRGSAGLDLAAPPGTAIKPVADGEVIEVGTGKTGGNFIRVRHADGTVTSYMHMENRAPFKRGDRVTQATVIGTVGSTGNASGPHLHLEAKDASGAQIDPEEYMRGSSPLGTPTDARRWDVDALHDQIDAKVASGKWSLEKAEEVRAYAMQRVQRDENLLARKESDADRAATEWFLQNMEFTDFNSMPKEIRDELSADAAVRWRSVAEQNKKAALGGGVLADGPIAVALGEEAIDSPELFVQRDLAIYADQMTRSEFDTLIKTQAKVRKALGKWTPNSGVTSAFNTQTGLDGKKYSDADKVSIKNIMLDYVYRWRDANGGKTPTESVYLEAYRHATANVKTSREVLGGFLGTMRSEDARYRTATGTDARVRNIARERLQAAGKTITPQAMAIMEAAVREELDLD